MNATKKVVKSDAAAKKQPKRLQQDTGSNKGVIAGVIIAAAVVLLSGVIAWENLHPKLILTVNGEKTYLEDMNYQIMQTEQMYNSIDSLYQQFGYTESYWDMEENGVTTQETAREQTINEEIERQILYAEAVKNGYEATSEDAKTAADRAKDMMKDMSEEQKKKTGFTEKNLTEILTEEEVAYRYRQDVIDGFDINDDEIRAGVDKEKYREYKTQTFFVSTASEEEKELTAAQKEERKQALVKEAEAAKNTKDWSKVLDEEDEKQLVSYEEINFIKEDTDYDAAVMKKAMTMKDGEISEVVEGEDGYYIIKMVDNDSDDRYEEEVENAITKVENQKFDEEYLAIYEKYEVKINEKEWNKVEMGNITM